MEWCQFTLHVLGITAADVVRDNLEHFVEVLFKGKPLPSRNNRRFYPRSRDIRNHVYLKKYMKKKSIAEKQQEREESVKWVKF